MKTEMGTSCLWSWEGRGCSRHVYGSCLNLACERMNNVIVVPFIDL